MTIACALDPKIDSGTYFSYGKVKLELKEAQEDDTAEWLWRTSEQLTGLAN